MKLFLNPVLIAGCLTILSTIGIGTAVHREMKDIEFRMWLMREGFLNEIAHLAASSLSLALKDGTLTEPEMLAAFKSFENLDSREYYDIAPTKLDIALQILIVNADGLVLYDSTSRDAGRDLSQEPLIASALAGQYHKTIEANSATTQMFVSIPLRVNGNIEGAVRVGKPAAVLLPILMEAEKSLILGGISIMGIALLVVLLIFVLLLKPLELWFAYVGVFKSKKFRESPRRRRGRFGSLGEIMDQMYLALSGRSYVADVLSTLSHELKSPMTSIRGILRIFEQPTPDADREQFLAEAHQQMDRVQSIMDRMMALASFEKRNSLKELQPIPLRGSILAIVDDLKPLMRHTGIQIDVGPFDELTLNCDKFLVKQAMTNLMLNALEHSPPGSRIFVSVLRRDKCLEIQFRDYGEGVPASAADLIFEKFYTLPRRGSSPNTGTGLGLNFVRQVAQLHFGDISITNHPDGGVLALLRFPRTLVAD